MSENRNESDRDTGSSAGYHFWAEQISRGNKSSDSNGNSDSNRNAVNPEDTAAVSPSPADSSGRADSASTEESKPEHPDSYYGSGYGAAADPAADSADSAGREPEEPAREKPRNYSYLNGAIPEEPVKKKGGGLKKLLKAAANALVFGLVAGAVFIGFNTIYYKLNPDSRPASSLFGGNENLNLEPPGRNTPTLSSTTVSQVKSQDYSLIARIVEETEPSVVTITSTVVKNYSWFGQDFSDESTGGGSGIIVGQNDEELLIATNNHVVEGTNKIAVKFVDGTEGFAAIKGSDAPADLAVISVPLDTLSAETRAAIKVATLGDSDAVKVGELTIAIGNALGYGQSVTVGYVSAKDREVTIDNNTMILLQTDAAINPGNSGGALLNSKGEVIGINSVKYASKEIEGIGFAIPISRAYPILNEFMNRENLKEEEKGYLGITIKNVTDDLINIYQWPAGVLVYSVTENGPAAKAGILAQDIITKINGSVVSDMDQLKEKVNSQRVGTKVDVTLMRYNNGVFEEKNFTVVLGISPEITPAPTPESAAEPTVPVPQLPSEEGQNGEAPAAPTENPLNKLPYTIPNENDGKNGGGKDGSLPNGGF